MQKAKISYEAKIGSKSLGEFFGKSIEGKAEVKE